MRTLPFTPMSDEESAHYQQHCRDTEAKVRLEQDAIAPSICTQVTAEASAPATATDPVSGLTVRSPGSPAAGPMFMDVDKFLGTAAAIGAGIEEGAAFVERRKNPPQPNRDALMAVVTAIATASWNHDEGAVKQGWSDLFKHLMTPAPTADRWFCATCCVLLPESRVSEHATHNLIEPG